MRDYDFKCVEKNLKFIKGDYVRLQLVYHYNN
jgi:hypothetical protein